MTGLTKQQITVADSAMYVAYAKSFSMWKIKQKDLS